MDGQRQAKIMMRVKRVTELSMVDTREDLGLDRGHYI